MSPAIWLQEAAKLYPDSPALLVGAKIIADYTGFADRAARVGAAFRDNFDIQPGDRVALFMPNRIEYLDMLYGAWFAGAIVLPINAKLHPREAAWMVEDAEAKLLICSGKTAGTLSKIVDADRTAQLDADSEGLFELYTSAPMSKPVHRTGDDVAWLFYTSGTTGRPKGVMITNSNIEAMTRSYFADVDAVEHNDAILYAAPMSHGAGLYNFMFVMRGARHIVPESGGFDATEIAGIAASVGNICMFAAPTMVRRMVVDAKARSYDGEGLKTIVYGGGPMYVADILEAVKVLGPRFAQIYGQGESPMTITALSKELVADRTHPRWRDRLASVGTPQSSVKVRIADNNGNELPRGEVGEILVSGSPVMKGYWGNASATAETLRNGWLWTGDMGAMDQDGFVTLHDRSKDLIVSGGTNIYPREVEEVLLTHPAVAQVSVVGKPDPEWGEIVVACVVLENGQQVDDAALDGLCIANIARFKRPKQYIHLEDLPKNAYGKVLKTELRKQLQ